MKNNLLAGLASGMMLFGVNESVLATSVNPLNDGGWELVAHMSNSGGMFDGNGELLPTYSYGTFDLNPTSATPDFERAFPTSADKILFITGDTLIWGITDYNELRTLIDARGGTQNPNLEFEIGINGVISNTTGNILSRNQDQFSSYLEDPWISISGSHDDGIANERIVWGENDYEYGIHQALKNNHGGINVYVRQGAVPEISEPTALALLSLGLLLLFTERSRRSREQIA